MIFRFIDLQFFFINRFIQYIMTTNPSMKRHQHEASGVVAITDEELHLTKFELKFCASSNSVCAMSEIRNGECL